MSKNNFTPQKQSYTVKTLHKLFQSTKTKSDPFVGIRNLIVVPSEILPGLLTALHLRFQHATKSQLTQLFNRHFFAIKSDPAIKLVVDSCTHCTSVKKIPRELFEQTLTPSATRPGELFYADVMKRSKQAILVARDVHSAFTTASIIPSEKADSLRNGLLLTTSNVRCTLSRIHVDNAPGFLPLENDPLLRQHGISLDYSRVKNKDSNSLIDKGIQELEREILNVNPSGGPLGNVQLQLVLETLNTRIRNRGLSSREILFQRDQITNDALDIDDTSLAHQQASTRLQNHHSGAKSKAKGGPPVKVANFKVGDLVFIKDEGTKNKVRDRYIIVKLEDKYAFLQKLGTKFMSTRYQVPLTQIYASSKPIPTIDIHHDSPSSDSDSDTLWEDISSNDSAAKEDAQKPLSVPPVPQLRPPSTRQRREPAWKRSGYYVC